MSLSNTTITAADFRYVQEIVYRVAGNVVEDGKSYLVATRLGPLAQQHGLPSVAALLTATRDNRDLMEDVVEAMTTRETMFFRDPPLFDALREHVLPPLVERARRGTLIQTWCIGCSTGQEPYSLAMLLEERFSDAIGGFRLLGSDLCRHALEVAQSGSYSSFEVQRGLPEELLERYFQPRGESWQIRDALRRRIGWRRVNLIESWPTLPRMDLVLLRNVLIYFDETLKRRILERLRHQLQPDGWLIVGAPENLMAWPELFTPISFGRAMAYRPTP